MTDNDWEISHDDDSMYEADLSVTWCRLLQQTLYCWRRPVAWFNTHWHVAVTATSSRDGSSLPPGTMLRTAALAHRYWHILSYQFVFTHLRSFGKLWAQSASRLCQSCGSLQYCSILSVPQYKTVCLSLSDQLRLLLASWNISVQHFVSIGFYHLLTL